MDGLQRVLEENIGKIGKFCFSKNDSLGGKLTEVFPDYVVLEDAEGVKHYVMLAHVVYFMFLRKGVE